MLSPYVNLSRHGKMLHDNECTGHTQLLSSNANLFPVQTLQCCRQWLCWTHLNVVFMIRDYFASRTASSRDEKLSSIHLRVIEAVYGSKAPNCSESRPAVSTCHLLGQIKGRSCSALSALSCPVKQKVFWSSPKAIDSFSCPINRLLCSQHVHCNPPTAKPIDLELIVECGVKFSFHNHFLFSFQNKSFTFCPCSFSSSTPFLHSWSCPSPTFNILDPFI